MTQYEKGTIYLRKPMGKKGFRIKKVKTLKMRAFNATTDGLDEVDRKKEKNAMKRVRQQRRGEAA